MTSTTTPPAAPIVPTDEEASGPVRALRGYVDELANVASARRLLGWDQQTKLPAKGAEARGRMIGALSAIYHERSTSDELGALISAVEDADPGNVEARVQRRDFDIATKLPNEFVRRCSEAASAGYVAWNKARGADDFALFLPHLETLVRLAREQAELFGYETEAYDALHDVYEEGSRAAELAPMFEALRGPINALLDAQPDPDTSVMERSWDVAAQERLGIDAVTELGFDFEAGRLDVTAHPFCIQIGAGDVRLTTRYMEHWLPCALFGTIHEAGHGIYEQSFARLGLPATIGNVPGLGMHESQSRMFENVIGRSRPFWERWFPRLQERFPEATRGVDLETFLRQVNTAKRSFIRVEADELSYNLHLGLRFEIERALVNGDLAPADLPGAWNDGFERWFGIRPTSDAVGCLQDVHWSGGSFGYFPTYTLGNVYAAQIVESARRDLPSWDDHIRSGDSAPIIAWLDEHVYRWGASRTGRETIEAISGGPVDVQPLLTYLTERFG